MQSRQSRSADPGRPPARRPGRDRPAAPRDVLVAAGQAYRSGDHAKARGLCEGILRECPDNADALHLLGIIAFQSGDNDGAASHLERAIVRDPSAPAMLSNLGNVRKAQGRLAESADLYSRALEIHADFPDAHNNLGVVRSDQNRPEEAIEHFKRALALKDDYAEAANNLGNLLLDLGSPGEAAAMCERAVAIAPEEAKFRINFGNARYAEGRTREASVEYLAALSIDANSVDAHSNLAVVLRDLGKYQESLKHFWAALCLEPAHDRARTGLMRVLKYVPPHMFTPDLDSILLECFARPDFRHQDVATAAAFRVKNKYPGVAWASGAANIGEPAATCNIPAATRNINDPAIKSLVGDALFSGLLGKTVNEDRDIELLLTGLRRAALLSAESTEPGNELPLSFLSALALQSHNNGYVLYVDEGEERALAGLRRRLEARLRSAPSIDAGLERSLLLYAAYAPPHGLANISNLRGLPGDSWSAVLRPAVQTILADQWEEREIESAIPSLTPVTDGTSIAVRRQYEQNPYPRWLSVSPANPAAIAASLRRRFPGLAIPAALQNHRVEVLVAGCGTGNHSIDLALNYKNAQIVAVDLSRRSLAYGKRMADRFGVENIEFLHGDILELASIGRKFSYIECAGVLHHMRSPVEGWNVLTGLLEPGGIMRIALYSELARRDITALRGRIRALGLKSAEADIRRFRWRLLAGLEKHDHPDLLTSSEFYDLGGCRDLLFHVSERTHTLPEIHQWLGARNMEFIGFDFENPRIKPEYASRYPDDPPMTDLTNWAAFEARFPDTFCGMYDFMCQKSGGEQCF